MMQNGFSFWQLCLAIPWERILLSRDREAASRVVLRPVTREAPALPRVPEPRPPQVHQAAVLPAKDGPAPIARPGCTAADESILVWGHLQGLARGKQGYGVLRVSKEHLEKAAEAADYSGRKDVGWQLRGVARRLPDIHDSEGAAALADELLPLVDECWELGRRCGGGNLSPAQLEKARALARDIKEGRITAAEAIKQLRGG